VTTTAGPAVVAVAHHSGHGHTAALAAAVAEGAAAAGAEVHAIAADAIVFGSPTYMGTASAAFHAFAEETSKRWFTQAWKDKLAAGFTNSGSKSGDKLHTLQFFTVLAAQHGMHWVGLGLLPGWNSSTASEFDLNRLGFFLGAAAQSNVDEGPEAVHKSDLATARELGRRVAGAAQVAVAGRAALAA
jgi:NAD(P)H dehydrogenase (quinone)